MPSVDVNGIQLYYERRGDGPRLLFLNGSGATLETTRLLLDPFAGHFDLVAHDQRGLGRTSIPPGPYTMADYAADAVGLLDALGWGRTRVLGLSFGGMVAQELAASYPDRVERLALLCTSPGGIGGGSYPLHELGSLTPDQRSARWPLLLDTRFTPEYLASHIDAAALAEMVAARATTERTDDEQRGEREQLGARAHHDVCDRLGAITSATLVAAGRYDGIAPVANSEAIAVGIHTSELRIYDGGHMFIGQDPQAIPDILEFLTREHGSGV